MANGDYDGRGNDRLPWLETVEEDHAERPPVLRIVLLVVLALAIVAAAILGYRWYQMRQGADGPGALIGAPEGDYKVKPDDPGGMQVEGEGDTAIATSNGTAMADAAVDMAALPEKPVDMKKAVPTPTPTGASSAVAAIPASGPASGPASVPASGAATSGGSLVQLGSFPDEAAADAEWGRISRKLPYLAPFGKSVQAAQVGGKTVYRLRVNAGSAGQATSLCRRIAAAGAACFVPRN